MKATPGADYVLTVADPRDFTDREIGDGVELANLLQAETFPEKAPHAVQASIASLRLLPKRYGLWSVRARTADGRLVAGISVFKDFDHDTNPDLAHLRVDVHPDHRRRGVATALIAHQVAFAQALDRTRFQCWTVDRQPAGEQLARALGGQVKSRSHVNRLLRTDVDTALLHRWVDEAATRAPGYELVLLDGRIPEELIEDFVELVLVMNTAPRDDFEVNDFTLTAAELREAEDRAAAAGVETWTVITRRRDTRDLAGLHQVSWRPEDPTTVNVNSTGVQPRHRGAALGRWMKAVMTLRVLDDRPEVREIRTGNADSNQAMLAINEAMGYRPWIAEAAWEVSREQVQRWLAARGADVPDVTSLVDGQRRTVSP